jgi:6-phosphofructokinase 1
VLPSGQNLTVPQRTERVEAQDLEIKILDRAGMNRRWRRGWGWARCSGRAPPNACCWTTGCRGGTATPHARVPTFEVPGRAIACSSTRRRCAAGSSPAAGLCPGINNVIRGLVLELTHSYGVKDIFGFRYGFEGMVARHGHEPVRLGPAWVSEITRRAAPCWGRRAAARIPGEMVDTLAALGIGALFVVGGDGTLRGATKIVAEIERRGLLISVIGIPKTIDNDIHFIDRSFGFESAFAAAAEANPGAHSRGDGVRATGSAR